MLELIYGGLDGYNSGDQVCLQEYRGEKSCI